ncbi:MAG TPA: hypothetical protein VMD56_13255 [Steroidobacteraceae bacterium]|nr:hypothetical protein [Steroidobacteraceae bacterium]
MSDDARPSAQLRPDCTRCCGLCCVAPPFDAAQGFAYDKPAHVACRHLRADARCGIHDELAARGFPACALFDCHGAGQRVTQQLFGGRPWTESRELAQRMFAAYGKYRALHELMALLETAARRVSAGDAARLRERRRLIDSLCESGAALEATVRVEAIRTDTLRLLRALLVE